MDGEKRKARDVRRIAPIGDEGDDRVGDEWKNGGLTGGFILTFMHKSPWRARFSRWLYSDAGPLPFWGSFTRISLEKIQICQREQKNL